jgi:hypothetical protein
MITMLSTLPRGNSHLVNIFVAVDVLSNVAVHVCTISKVGPLIIICDLQVYVNKYSNRRDRRSPIACI